MRATRLLVVTTTGLLLAAGNAAQGQSFGGQSFGGQSALQKVEDKVGGAPGATGAASAGASDTAPGSGYLGGEFDDPKLGQKGVLVIAVRPRGPAETGGLKPNDLITSIDGKPVTGLTDLDAVLDKATVGQRLRMTVNRLGRMENLTVALGTRPPPAELTPGEAPPPAAPGPSASPGAASAPAPAPATPPGILPAPGATRMPALGSPSLGSPSPSADRAPTGGAFSPSPETRQPADVEVPAPAPPADAGAGIRARPFDRVTPPATTTPADTSPSGPADTAPGSASAGAATSGGPSLGITVDALTDEARQAHGLTVRRGALITAVRPGSPADRAGLPIGGLVVQLNTRPIASADDLVSAIRAARPGQEIELGYFEGPTFQRKTIMLAPASGTAAPGSLPRHTGSLPAERPLIGRVERMVDGFARGGVSGPSTVYDPSVVAELQRQVSELTMTVKELESRLRTLEGNRGTTGPTPAAPAVTPGFGSAPIGPATPGFVPGLGQPTTNP